MTQAFDTDLMDDLFYESAEGPAQMRYDEFDEFGYDEGFDDYNTFEDDDAFMGGLADEFDEMGDYSYGDYDSLEEELADALAEEDTDEFLRRLRNIARRVGGAARRVGRGIGSVARVVGPIASVIPIPQAQAIGRIANIAGRLLADEADEFEALDELFDYAEAEDAIDAAAPFLSAVTLRTAMPGIARTPRPVRRQLLRSTTQATRTLARRQGPRAARAVPRVVQGIRRAAMQRRLPPRAVPTAIRRATARIARSPGAVRRLVRPTTSIITPRRRRGIVGRGGFCPVCGRTHRYNLRGPVSLTIQGR